MTKFNLKKNSSFIEKYEPTQNKEHLRRTLTVELLKIDQQNDYLPFASPVSKFCIIN